VARQGRRLKKSQGRKRKFNEKKNSDPRANRTGNKLEEKTLGFKQRKEVQDRYGTEGLHYASFGKGQKKGKKE